jgi:nicotinamidase-related amidase
MAAFTLFDLANRRLSPPPLAEAVLILIDYQNEYLSGPLKLVGAVEAIERARVLLDAVRAAGVDVVHVAHKGAPGGPFDRGAARGAIIDTLVPLAGEVVIEKPRPNAFSGTTLAEVVGAGRKIIIAGFMTHNCVSSTARAAFDLGYDITIAADACATRDLPGLRGVVAAASLHEAALAGLADMHGLVTPVANLV